MTESAEDRQAGNTPSVLNGPILLRLFGVCLGCFLLLYGNTLPWPCSPSPNPSPDCSPLVIHDVSGVLVTALLAMGIVLVALMANLLDSGSALVVWFILLLVPYVLFVARLRPITFIETTMYFPLADVNQDLGGPSLFVMPASLIISWLALRPRGLHRKWRLLATVGVLALLFLTVYFLVLMGNRPYQITIPSFIKHQGILHTGPLLILAGGVLLLGAEYVSLRRDRTPAVELAGPARGTATHPPSGNRVGFWSALLASASPILLIILTLLAAFSPGQRRFDAGVYYLTSVFTAGLGLLLPASFVVLMASLARYAPPGKKTWAWIGLVLAMVYALGQTLSTCLFSPLVGASRQLYERLATSFPILLRYRAFDFALVSLALLFTLPVFHGGGIKQVIRWCVIILGGLTLASGLGYLLTSDRIPTVSILTDSIGKWVVFPVTMILIAVVFRRAEREGAERH